ncbi:phage tail tape measure protein [Streptomyces noursei]|uniref:phage tail tape measure protein n=1 Tax=Streptomyces noursei TaxID=1971 RepID=UPI00382105DC
MGALPPIFIEFLGKKTGFSATAKGVRTELAEVEAQGGGHMSRLGAVSKAALLGIGVAAGVTAVKTVRMAADFQTAMTRVRTGAGESASNMKLVSDGVLAMAGEVGQSTQQLTQGLYTVESAGYHGSDALKVLRVSAMGAKVGAADLGTVTDAVTTALNAYHMSASNAVPVMNALVATEAEGKTNMEALAGSMASILPVASAAHVGLNEVLGAMATMTAQGTSADVAATYLRQTIGQLSNPSAKAAATMKGLGLSATQVSQDLGSHGLAYTLNELTTAIQSKMGPSGTVLISTLQKAAKNSKDFQGALNKASGSQKTYIGALATMVGGTKSMMGALQLTGAHAKTFADNVKGVGEHVKAGGKSVEGWADVQKTFNQRMAEAKGAAQAFGIQIGQALLPAATKMLGYFAKIASLAAKHHTAFLLMAAGLGAIALGMTVATVASWDFNASLLADPLVWIVVAIVAVVAGLVLLITHWKDVAAWLSSAWHTAVHAVGDAWNWLVGKTESAWHWIENAATSAWHSVSSFFSTAWHTVTDPIASAWHWVTHITSVAWDGISGFFRKWWPLLLAIFAPPIALVISIWNHCHAAITSVAKTAWNAVTSFLSSIWSGIKEAAAFLWLGIQIAIVNPIKSVWRDLVEIWNFVSDWLHSQWLMIKRGAAIIWLGIQTSIVDPIRSAWHTLTGLIGNIGSSIWSGLVSAWNSVKRVGSWFLSIGSDIVNGIVNGVENAAGSLFGSLKNLASNALSSAKSFLGINSPSRLFADHVGSGITEGIAKGITEKAHLVHQAVSNATGAALGGLAVEGGTFNLGVGTSGGFGGSTTVVNVHVEGSVMAEQDLRDTLQREMLRLGARNSGTWQPYRR